MHIQKKWFLNCQSPHLLGSKYLIPQNRSNFQILIFFLEFYRGAGFLSATLSYGYGIKFENFAENKKFSYEKTWFLIWEIWIFGCAFFVWIWIFERSQIFAPIQFFSHAPIDHVLIPLHPCFFTKGNVISPKWNLISPKGNVFSLRWNVVQLREPCAHKKETGFPLKETSFHLG